MTIYSIYKATCLVNNKNYIGFTSNFKKRKKEHLTSKDNFYFHKALKKYGKDNFIWEILYESHDLEHTLNIMEPLYIFIHNSYLEGYNLTTGGEGSPQRICTQETRQKLSKAITKDFRKYLTENMTGKNSHQAKIFEFINPLGEKFIIHGEFKKFCKTQKLSLSTMNNKLTGFRKNSYGNCIGWSVKII